MLGRFQASTAYMRARILKQILCSREMIDRYHARRCAMLATYARTNIPFYAGAGEEFEDFPVIDKTVQQANFAAFNHKQISLDEVIVAMQSGQEMAHGCYVGQSTGTSGNRGRFVITQKERFTWLGTIVAKTMPDALFRRRRVALALPGFSSLYKSAPHGSRVQLAYFDLTQPVSCWRDDMVRFAPHVVVAPPKVLRLLAEDGVLLGVETFSGAEVLDQLDRAIIEKATGRPVREIYMATEGLFGVSCQHGMLHLAEDVVRFEWECVPNSHLVVPIVTDLVRHLQPMIRYRMNDLLELSNHPCPCGSPFQAVARIHGRKDDVFTFETARGRVVVTPDVLRNAVVDSDPTISDFRILQKANGKVVLALDATMSESIHRSAREALRQTLQRLGVSAEIESQYHIEPRFDRKLRRVERERS
jgi:putative adenylate-forming enzyme